MKSPLLKLGLILRIYSYVGVFPARVEGNSVQREGWRLLPQVAALLLYAIGMTTTHLWSSEPHCLTSKIGWDYWEGLLSPMGNENTRGFFCVRYQLFIWTES